MASRVMASARITGRLLLLCFIVARGTFASDGLIYPEEPEPEPEPPTSTTGDVRLALSMFVTLIERHGDGSGGWAWGGEGKKLQTGLYRKG